LAAGGRLQTRIPIGPEARRILSLLGDAPYLVQAKEHEQMVAAYKANPSLTAKSQASTINHCEYFVKTFNELAVKSQELAKLHKQMANDVEQK
jgi:hypothetical protein